MDEGSVLLFAETLSPRVVESAAPHLKIKSLSSLPELASAIVEEQHLLCVLLQLEEIDEAAGNLLVSLRETFPLLIVGVLSPPSPLLPAGVHHIDSRGISGEIADAVQALLSSGIVKNRRVHPRYDWPLKGFLSFDRKSWQEYRIRSLSSGGAFLECQAQLPEVGSRVSLRIIFQNFAMNTECEILDPRHASSNLPVGFGVKFIGFPEEAAKIIDRIVKDALIRTLLNVRAKPEPPSIDEGVSAEGFDLL